MNYNIIISPSKNMNLDEIDRSKKIKLNERSVKILDKIQSLNKKDIVEKFYVSENLAEKIYNMYESFYDNGVKEAIYLYEGYVFKNINLKYLSKEKLKFLNDKICIVSAFYGILKPFEYIYPYRLDFNVKIKIDGDSIENYQKGYINDKLKGKNIINLASK